MCRNILIGGYYRLVTKMLQITQKETASGNTEAVVVLVFFVYFSYVIIGSHISGNAPSGSSHGAGGSGVNISVPSVSICAMNRHWL
jgi:hypothetical protein